MLVGSVVSVVTKLIDHTKIKHPWNPVDVPLLLYVQGLMKSHDRDTDSTIVSTSTGTKAVNIEPHDEDREVQSTFPHFSEKLEQVITLPSSYSREYEGIVFFQIIEPFDLS